MWTRRAFTGLVAAGTAGAVAAQTTPTSRRAEAQALCAFAERTHPDGAAASLDAGWRQGAETFAAGAEAMDDAHYAVEALRLLSWFRDGHTVVYLPQFAAGPWKLRYPIGREVFSDGLYVTAAKDAALPLLGARVTRIGGVPTEQLIRRFADVWPATNKAWAHRWSILLLSSPGLLQAFGALTGPAEGPILIEGVDAGGRHVTALVRPVADAAVGRQPLQRRVTELERYGAAHPYGAQPDPSEDGRNLVWRTDGGRVLVICLDRMSDDDFGKPFKVFDAEVSAALQDGAARRLIVDLRRNGGGNNMLCEPLRKRIARSRFNRPGGLYVLTSPHTFSAAQNLANRLERETFAVFVGEPTGLSPNHCGDAKVFKGEATSLPAMVSTIRWSDSTPFDRRGTIMPDVPVAATFADFVVGRDSALEAALAHEDRRAFDEALLTAPWERESQQQTWKPFWA